MIALATRTASGNPAPTGFVITLWVLVVLFLGGAVGAVVLGVRLRRRAPLMDEELQQKGKRAQAGCLLMAAIPSVMIGLFLLSWVVAITS